MGVWGLGLARGRLIYDLESASPVTYADLYDSPLMASLTVSLGATREPSRFTLALENVDGSKDSVFAVKKQVRVDVDPGTGVWSAVLDGYLTRIRRVFDPSRQEKVLILEGRDFGSYVLGKRIVSVDYELNPRLVCDAAVDLVSGQGVTSSNVQSSAVIVETSRKPYELRTRWDVLVDLAVEAGCDFFVDENRDLNFFKAHPDAGNPSSGKVFDDSNLRYLEYEEDADLQVNKVWAASIVQMNVSHINEACESVGFWNAPGFTKKFSTSGAPNTNAKAVQCSSAGGASPVVVLGRYGDADQLGLVENQWQRFTFTVNYSLAGGRESIYLDLVDAEGVHYWRRDITGDVVSGVWKTLDYQLPSENSSGWTTVGAPTKVNRVNWVFTGSSVPTGSVVFQWCFFYRRLRRSSSVAETPLLEKAVVDPTVTDEADLEALAASELSRVKNVFKTGVLRVDGDPSLKKPGYSAVLSSARMGIPSATVRIDQVVHRLGRKQYSTTVGFSTVSGRSFAAVRERLVQAGLLSVRPGVLDRQ
ncbi:MAG: hypothetical protein HYU39_04665 [Thaumarchaeota archaeon]|nr:hypothetical protein [Nitrososphaerota archaeon]